MHYIYYSPLMTQQIVNTTCTYTQTSWYNVASNNYFVVETLVKTTEIQSWIVMPVYIICN